MADPHGEAALRRGTARPRVGLGDHQGVPAILPSSAVARWQAAPFTYPDVGGTRGERPKGYSTLRRSRRLHRRDFSQAAEELMSWQVHERAGLRIAASSPRADVGTVVMMRLGIGRAAITAACRVVYVIDTPARVGFAYGTLPGHPESGESCLSSDTTPMGCSPLRCRRSRDRPPGWRGLAVRSPGCNKR